MALMEISVMPVGQGTSMSRIIARSIQALEKEPGVEFEMTSMGTIISGEVERLLQVALKMHLAVREAGAQRIVTTVKIDDRRDKTVTMTSKVESLKEKLGKRAG